MLYAMPRSSYTGNRGDPVDLRDSLESRAGTADAAVHAQTSSTSKGNCDVCGEPVDRKMEIGPKMEIDRPR